MNQPDSVGRLVVPLIVVLLLWRYGHLEEHTYQQMDRKATEAMLKHYWSGTAPRRFDGAPQ